VVVIGSLPGAAVAGALVVVPSLWLGGIFRWRGVALVAVIGGIAIVLVGTLSRSGDLEIAAGHVAWMAIFALVAAVTMASIISVWDNQVDLLEAQRAELAVTLSALEEQQQYAEAIVQAVGVGLAATGADGSYSGLNPRHDELMAFSFPDGHSGRAGEVGEIYAVDNHTRLERAQLPSVRAMAGETFTETLWIGKESTTRRAITVSSRPMRGAGGAFAGAVIAYHDSRP
jgi:two-component system phosphate regulon sensor histidine kinase PhoR